MSKELIPAPCEHYDIVKKQMKHTCPDTTATSEGEACQYYLEELSSMDADSDPHGPCKRKNTAYADDKTLDLLEETCDLECGLNDGGTCTSEYHIKSRHHCLKHVGDSVTRH